MFDGVTESIGQDFFVRARDGHTDASSVASTMSASLLNKVEQVGHEGHGRFALSTLQLEQHEAGLGHTLLGIAMLQEWARPHGSSPVSLGFGQGHTEVRTSFGSPFCSAHGA